MRLLLFAAALLLSGCAYVGDTKPPTLDIPAQVIDLRAAEYGAKVLVEFTLPALTTEGLGLTDVKSLDLNLTAGSFVRDLTLPNKEPGAVHYEFAAADWTGKTVTLRVRATGPKGKSAEWSNAVVLPVVPPLATPANLAATTVPEGVRLQWSGSGPRYRIFRTSGDATAAALGNAEAAEYLDTSASFGSSYRYFVQALDTDLHQGEISAIVDITPRDTFPPAVPLGLSAVAGVNSMELAWERNTEDDFQGYNLYRSIDGGPYEMLSGKITAPTFSDRTVTAGRKYSYQLTSLDDAGNESARSTAVETIAQ